MRRFWPLLFLLSSCTSEQEEVDFIRPVRYEVVETAQETGLRFFSGYAKADVETNLSFRVRGRIEGIYVRVGSIVRRGDPIARLDPKDYILEVQEAEARVLDAEAQLRKAEANYGRIRNLYETESASRAELDAARMEYESGAAGVKASRTRHSLAKIQLSYTELEAPLSGAIATKDVEINENVEAGQPIVTLNSDERVKVTIAMPENLISEIREGAEVDVFFTSIPGRSFVATVTEVGVARTASTTFPVTVQLNKESPEVRSGMSAEVLFEFSRGDETIIIPGYALFEDEGKRYVFVLEDIPEERGVFIAHLTEVEIGDIITEGVMIKKGLNSGDKIVTAGVQFLVDGQKVRLAEK